MPTGSKVDLTNRILASFTNQGLVFLSSVLLSTRFVRERAQEVVMRSSLLSFTLSYVDRSVANRGSAMRGKAEAFPLQKNKMISESDSRLEKEPSIDFRKTGTCCMCNDFIDRHHL